MVVEAVPYIKYLGSKYLQVISTCVLLHGPLATWLVTSACKHLGGSTCKNLVPSSSTRVVALWLASVRELLVGCRTY
jgi:hypothetical protein